MPKIVHAADFHLDSAFGGLPEDMARQRRRESRDLADRLADLVLAEGAELVLLCGDLFDGERVFPETVELLRGALGRMACPVFIAPGNHDPYTPRSPYAAAGWPDNVHIFTKDSLEAVELPELNTVVHGAAFTGRSRTEQLMAGFSAPADGRIHVLCIHGDVDALDSPYGPVTTAQLAASGLDYAAFGHVHQCSGLRRAGNTCWAYPGCPEGRGFDELGDKGVLAGSVEKDGAQMAFVPLCRRRYHILTADVTEKTPREALAAVLPPTAAMDVCRVIFTGETGEAGVDLAALETAFRDKCYALELRDRTTVAEDIWARAEEDSLRGIFLRELRRQYEAAGDDRERETVVRAVRFGLAALDGRDLG